jgi:hypothetical protein
MLKEVDTLLFLKVAEYALLVGCDMKSFEKPLLLGLLRLNVFLWESRIGKEISLFADSSFLKALAGG